jgi:hypothetical protein
MPLVIRIKATWVVRGGGGEGDPCFGTPLQEEWRPSERTIIFRRIGDRAMSEKTKRDEEFAQTDLQSRCDMCVTSHISLTIR